jgi:microcystin-dependent protein
LAASKASTSAGYRSTGTVVALNSGSITNVTGALPTVTNSVAGSSIPISIMPPYLGLNYFIALQGIFPSRN